MMIKQAEKQMPVRAFLEATKSGSWSRFRALPLVEQNALIYFERNLKKINAISTGINRKEMQPEELKHEFEGIAFGIGWGKSYLPKERSVSLYKEYWEKYGKRVVRAMKGLTALERLEILSVVAYELGRGKASKACDVKIGHLKEIETHLPGYGPLGKFGDDIQKKGMPDARKIAMIEHIDSNLGSGYNGGAAGYVGTIVAKLAGMLNARNMNGRFAEALLRACEAYLGWIKNTAGPEQTYSEWDTARNLRNGLEEIKKKMVGMLSNETDARIDSVAHELENAEKRKFKARSQWD